MKCKIGWGSSSIILSIIGLIWGITIKGSCVGDFILNSIGLNAWTSGPLRTHIGIFYSLIFFIPAYILASKNRGDWGSNIGRKVSVFMSVVVGIVMIVYVIG